MTDINAALANNSPRLVESQKARTKPMKTLFQHIGNCQDNATHVCGLLEAAAQLDNDATCSNGLSSILHIALQNQRQLMDDLDRVNLPRHEGETQTAHEKNGPDQSGAVCRPAIVADAQDAEFAAIISEMDQTELDIVREGMEAAALAPKGDTHAIEGVGKRLTQYRAEKAQRAKDSAEKAVGIAYQVNSLLRTLSMAVDGAQITGGTFEHAGGGAVIDMASDLTGTLIDTLEGI